MSLNVTTKVEKCDFCEKEIRRRNEDPNFTGYCSEECMVADLKEKIEDLKMIRGVAITKGIWSSVAQKLDATECISEDGAIIIRT